MKWLLILAILVCSLKSFSQTIHWETNNETYVNNYEIQISQDSIKFRTVKTVQPERNDTNYYAYPIKKEKWYRVKANMISGTFTTDQLILKNEIPIIFINPSKQKIQLQ